MTAIVHLLPTALDMQTMMGSNLSQAFGQFAATAGVPGARIPVDVKEEALRHLEFASAVRSESDTVVIRFFDDKDRELAVVPLIRVDYVEFK